ncbi:hypothetical protein CIP107525_02152 [Corynebacterium diphtheriae]|nr:hypothetical protein CIP107525_02152 [Corynebacterium diphtheriae]
MLECEVCGDVGAKAGDNAHGCAVAHDQVVAVVSGEFFEYGAHAVYYLACGFTVGHGCAAVAVHPAVEGVGVQVVGVAVGVAFDGSGVDFAEICVDAERDGARRDSEGFFVGF